MRQHHILFYCEGAWILLLHIILLKAEVVLFQTLLSYFPQTNDWNYIKIIV